MARRRFFVPSIHRQQAELTGDDAHHLVRVLRVEAGQQYEISDGRAVFLATVAEAHKNRVAFDVGEPVALKPLPVRIHLLFALIKFERLEWILEKGTEAGVDVFQPVIAERSEKGLERAAPKRRERWERIIVEAAQQSRRDTLPVLRDPVALASVYRYDGHRLLLDASPGATPILEYRSLTVAAQNGGQAPGVALLIGPEGGWTENERSALAGSGWSAVSLGPLVLRAETAALAAAAIMMAAAKRE